jgi:hypothetical protein
MGAIPCQCRDGAVPAGWRDWGGRGLTVPNMDMAPGATRGNTEFRPICDERKKVLVLPADLVKVMATMKRLFTLIVLLGIVMSAALTGCEQKPADQPVVPDTNAAPAAPPAPAAPATK